MAHTCQFDQNPVTGRTLPTTTFFDELAFFSRATSKIVVLDYDLDKLDSGERYSPSYNLVKIRAGYGRVLPTPFSLGSDVPSKQKMRVGIVS